MTREERKDILIKIFIPMIIGMIIFFLILFLMEKIPLSQNGKNISDKQILTHGNNYRFPYVISQPKRKFKLPHRLDEISGLSYLEPNKLLCVQDEKGALYVFDLEKGKVEEKFIFGEENDYEDIEIVKKSAYVLKSNGTLLKVKKFLTDTPKVKKYTTFLSKENDAEGLAFDAESEALFIACKGTPYLKNNDKSLEGKKAVYQFDLRKKELLEKAVYVIDKECIKNLDEEHSLVTKFFLELCKLLNPRGDDDDFQPSGIAVHPKTKNIYMISSADRMLLVINRSGEIIASVKLPKKLFKQPEGICFDPEGDLFISNEKKGKRANILQFAYGLSEKET